MLKLLLPPKGKSSGIVVPALVASELPNTLKPTDPAGAPSNEQPEPNTIEEMLAQNPGINGSTLVNMLKAKGFVISKATTTKPDSVSADESDSASTMPQTVRTHENATRLTGNLNFRTARMKESSARDNGIGYTSFDVVLIEEGMGNFGTAYYYTKEALTSAIPIFEGKKIYADHPSLDDEQNRPERSVKDILGHFENIRLEEVDGRALLTGTVKILPDEPYRWCRALMAHAVEFATKYPDKEFVGLSINASGDASEQSIDDLIKAGVPEGARLKLEQAQQQGISSVRVVSALTDAVSCDLVTEAGAGGKVREMLENDKTKEMDMKTEKKEESKEALPPGIGPAEAAVDAAHDDAAQDKALIKKMMDQYLGDSEMDESEQAHLSACMKAAMESGMSEDEAMKCASYGMKMAKIMSKKAEAEKPAAEPAAEEAKAEAKVEAEEKKEAVESKESAAVVAVKGENAALKEKIAKLEAKAHLETMLRDLRESRKVTDEIRKLVGEPKSVDSVEKTIKGFMEGVRAARGGESLMAEAFSFGGEKVLAKPASALGSFADCVNE